LHESSAPRGALTVSTVFLYCGAMTDEAAAPKPDERSGAEPAEAAAAPAPGEAATAPPTVEGGPQPGTEELTPEQRYPKPRPKDEPEKVVQVRSTIETRLSAMFERYLVDEHGNYVLGLETARVFVVPTWLESGATVVRVFAITNLDVPVTADLTTYLLAKNLDFVFGGFALDVDNGAVWFNHNVLGDFMAPEEIKGRFGGRLYVETPDEAVPTPATPGYL
jgi:hypothetical protein